MSTGGAELISSPDEA